MIIQKATSSSTSIETMNRKMVMDLPSWVILKPLVADGTRPALQDSTQTPPSLFHSLWLLPRDTFLKQTEQSSSNLLLSHKEVTVPPGCNKRLFRLSCSYLCWPC